MQQLGYLVGAGADALLADDSHLDLGDENIRDRDVALQNGCERQWPDEFNRLHPCLRQPVYLRSITARKPRRESRP